MKKWLTGVVFFLLLLTASIYILIPRTLSVTRVVSAKCNVNGGFKFLGDATNWIKWWPNEKSGHGFLAFNGNDYRVLAQSYPVIGVAIQHRDSSVRSAMTVLSGATLDSSIIQWACSLDGSMNPVKRVQTFFQARALGEDMTRLLAMLQPFLGRVENVYGIPIRETSTKDSFLLATRMTLSSYPSTGDIYTSLQTIRLRLKEAGARETNSPMLNITPLANGGYQVMAAIPTDKEIKEREGLFSQKLVPGKYLVSEVRGGIYTVKKAMGQLQGYIQDFQRTAMAIPFESLVTDRGREPDTAKWVTRIYYPVY